MKCVICKNGNLENGKTTVVLERKGVTVVFKEVPAQVCDQCGEAYLNDDISKKVFEEAGNVSDGTEVNIRKFSAA